MALHLRRVASSAVIAVVSLVLAGRARAEWIFGQTIDSDQAYLRSPPTPGWFIDYPVDPNFAFSQPTSIDNRPMTVLQAGVGNYWAHFPGLARVSHSIQGNAQVTAFGPGSNYCKLWGWEIFGEAIDVHVRCFDTYGNDANSLFNVNYIRRVNDDGLYPVGPEAAYLLAQWPSWPYPYSPSDFAWNSTGLPITISHMGTGQYSVVLSGQNGGTVWSQPSGGECAADKIGTVEVTAYGSDNAHCGALDAPSRIDNGNDTQIQVVCRSGTEFVDSMFVLNYSTMSPNASPTAAYAYEDVWWENNHQSPGPYTRQLSDTSDGNAFPHCLNSPVSITTGGGSAIYDVLFPDLRFPYAHPYAQVTTVGGGLNRCKILDLYKASASPANVNANGIHVQVACFYPTGVTWDSNFIVNVSTQEYRGQ